MITYKKAFKKYFHFYYLNQDFQSYTEII